jgi:tetratricopeptide (TPR) repeat protein
MALDYLGRAVELAPHVASIWNDLGLVCREMGDVATAVKCYKRAVALAPDDLAVRSGYCATLLYDPDATPEQVFQAHADYGKAATQAKELP